MGKLLAAAKPSRADDASATMTVDPPNPKYGDMITLTATVENGEGLITRMKGTYTHEFGTSFSFSTFSDDPTYSDDVGLYAPNWPSGAAHAVVNCEIVTSRKSGGIRTEIIGTLEFEIAP